MYSNGNLYLKYNSNLLYHGCIPLNEDGSLKEVTLCKETLKGKSLLDKLDRLAREAYFLRKIQNQNYMVWTWCGIYGVVLTLLYLVKKDDHLWKIFLRW